MARFDLTDFEWSVIQPLLPTKVRGVPRVDDRRVLNGIFWRLRTGAPWADIPARYGPPTTCVNRFNRWRKAGVWTRILEAVSVAYDGDIQIIDSSSCISMPPTPKKRMAHPVCKGDVGRRAGLHQRIRSQGFSPGQDGSRASGLIKTAVSSTTFLSRLSRRGVNRYAICPSPPQTS
jgi:transposase